MTYSLRQKSVPAAISEPDATPGDHYCIGRNCPKCRRGRNRIACQADRPRTPNHYCLGPGCPKCNTPPHSRALSTSSLPLNCVFQFVTTHDEHPLFSGPDHCSDSEIYVTSRMHSEPGPPRHCRVIPCKVRGRRHY